MPDAAGAKQEPEDSDFEVDVEDDDDVPLAKKKQKSARCGVSQIRIVSVSCSLLSTHELKVAIRLSANVPGHETNNQAPMLPLCLLPNLTLFYHIAGAHGPCRWHA